MVTDPRRFDLLIRSVTTAAIAFLVVIVAAIETLRTGSIPNELSTWGAIIIGVYFGSHTSLNGGGVRATRDNELADKIIEAGRQTTGTSSSSTITRTETEKV
jgi:hypothetical protein